MVERIEINLLPAEYRVHKRALTLQREIVYPFLVLIILVVGFALFSLTLQGKVSQTKNEITSLNQQILQNKPIYDEIKRLRNDRTVIQEKIRALERIDVNREKWVRLMEVFASRLPQFTWIVNVTEENSTPPMIHIEGRTLSFPEVANYMTQLRESEYIKDISLALIEQIDAKKRIFKFNISCEINPDVKLQDSNGNSETAE